MACGGGVGGGMSAQPTIITHHPMPSCHRTIRRPFGKRGTWNFPVPRTRATIADQKREAIAREAQRIMVHARWAARRIYQHAEFESLPAPGLSKRMTITRKRPQADVEYLLRSEVWLADEARKLGVHDAVVAYVAKVARRLAGIAA